MLNPDHSVPFNVHAWSGSESIIELVDTLYASLDQKTLTSQTLNYATATNSACSVDA